MLHSGYRNTANLYGSESTGAFRRRGNVLLWQAIGLGFGKPSKEGAVTECYYVLPSISKDGLQRHCTMIHAI